MVEPVSAIESAPSPRPYAARARELCEYFGSHDADAATCSSCHVLEQRLTPIHQIPGFGELLADANLTITNPFATS